MGEILSIIIIVFGVLQIILFFKIWGMTNNVRKIRSIMETKIQQDNTNRNGAIMKLGSDIEVGDLVVELNSERQLKVSSITEDGRYECRVSGGVAIAGVFNRDEIELFDKYWSKKSGK